MLMSVASSYKIKSYRLESPDYAIKYSLDLPDHAKDQLPLLDPRITLVKFPSWLNNPWKDIKNED